VQDLDELGRPVLSVHVGEPGVGQNLTVLESIL
jgi:hypothetical protein